MAVRGILTQKCIEKILNATIDPVLGDAGILAPMLFENQITKSNLIGIIPHFKEQDAPQVHRIKKEYPDAIVINLRKEPLDVIQEIAQCEHIISSSLHGLIIADSFRIPNIRVFFTDAPMGDGFKFDDYYSAYGLNNPPNILSDQNIPTINNIVDQYKITNDMVDKMQHDMFDCMNKYFKRGEEESWHNDNRYYIKYGWYRTVPIVPIDRMSAAGLKILQQEDVDRLTQLTINDFYS